MAFTQVPDSAAISSCRDPASGEAAGEGGCGSLHQLATGVLGSVEPGRCRHARPALVCTHGTQSSQRPGPGCLDEGRRGVTRMAARGRWRGHAGAIPAESLTRWGARGRPAWLRPPRGRRGRRPAPPGPGSRAAAGGPAGTRSALDAARERRGTGPDGRDNGRSASGCRGPDAAPAPPARPFKWPAAGVPPLAQRLDASPDRVRRRSR